MKTTAGTVMYGMHFYPGLAQYDEGHEKSYKIFLNETVLRKMDPTFAGKPIFVEHVDEVDASLDQLRKEADGWVVESFFNEADGKHWVKMVIVSEKAQRAIKNGYKLSNAYLPKLNGKNGIWNNIQYQNEVVDGEYEHLAIVKNPRYAESVIMLPEEFKDYNQRLKIELDKIANSKENTCMKLKFWNRKPVENSTDFETLSVSLPKSGKEYTIFQIVNAMDELEEKKKSNSADLASQVKLHDETICTVSELIEKFKNAIEEIQNSKKNEEKEPKEMKEEQMCNEEDDEEAKKKALELAAHEEKEIKEDKEKKENKKKNEVLKEEGHFNKLKNAPLSNQITENRVVLSEDRVARGKAKYGSK